MEEFITKLFRRNRQVSPENEQPSEDLELPPSWLMRHKEIPEGFKIRRGHNLVPAILERLNRRLGRGTPAEKERKPSQGDSRPS